MLIASPPALVLLCVCMCLSSPLFSTVVSRFDGVVPQDDQSRQRLADDAYDMAISWGKPAGRIALLAVDMLSFLLIFRCDCRGEG